MTEESKKKNKIIGIGLGILIVLLVVISSTYAYWQITKSQTDSNNLIAACLDFDVNFNVGIDEDGMWPIDSYEAMGKIDGYTFTVTNNCDEPVSYVVGLESLTESSITSYLNNASIGIGFDDEILGTYEGLTDLEGPTVNARYSKELRTATVVKGSPNTHNLKLWVHESSDIEEQGKGFAGRVFITGGQNVDNDNPSKLTAESCFEMNGEEIVGYDKTCGTNVVIPGTVNGSKVKTVDTDAFRETIITNHYLDAEGEEVDTLSVPNANIAFVSDGYTPGDSINDENISYVIILVDDTELNDIAAQMNYTAYNVGEEPDLEVGQIRVYQNLDKTAMESTFEGAEYKTSETKISITGLDLSLAYNLEKIEARAFTNVAPKTSIDNIESYPISLTSLTFGENTNAIEIGYGAFARIDIDELTTYTSYYIESTPEDSLGEDEMALGYFAYSQIDKLTIKPTKDSKIVSEEGYGAFGFGLYDLIYVNNLIIDEGITEIGDGAFGFLGENDGTLSLPSTLTTIGAFSFVNIPYRSVTIPSSVVSIGESAFSNYYNLLETIVVKRSEEDFLANVSVGDDWDDTATVVYEP